ncbi:hypothetical protein [Pyrobaculum ferrireducens]|uniref:hypothetical protein n=1 Tax=Pyrobaculum ferrireducens TaxID=1104324 RepID=UPI000AA8A974|nr:hypothetical protein [Pyrobaculum ferrireducens]
MVVDYFQRFNEELVKKLLEGFPWRVVDVVGPPRSGKSYFIENYSSKLREAGRDVELRERTATSRDELGEAYAGGGPYRLVYCIPWDRAKDYASDDAKRAVELIKRHFTPVEYLGVGYMPPGFAAEVVKRMRESDEEAAVKYLEEQREAYKKFSTLLAPDVWDRVREVLKRVGGAALRDAVPFLTKALHIDVVSHVSKFAPLVFKFLDLIAAVIKVFGKNWITQWIEQREQWKGLHEDLRKVLVWKAAAALGRSGEEVEKALDALYGLDTAMLDEVVEKIEEKLAELEARVSVLEAKLGPLNAVYTEPEELGVERRDGVLYVMGEPYVDPARHGLAQAVDEVERKVREVVERGGVLAIVGPRGVGKSTLVRAVLAEVLRRAAVRGVINVNRLKLDDLPEVVDGAGRSYLLFYDPTTPRFYELGGLEKPLERPRPEAVGIVADLVNLTHRGGKPRASVVLVLPTDIYNALGEEVKRLIVPVVLDLKSVEFLAEVIRRYSGCRLEGEGLRALAGEIAKFDEGYTLVARLVGEELSRRGCRLEKVEEVVRAAGGRALRFMLIYVNQMLRVRWRGPSGTYEDEDMAEIFSQILAARRYYSRDLGPGNAVAPPLLLERWARWRCAKLFKSERCPREPLPKEVYIWLSRRQHDLIETALFLAAYANLLEEAAVEDIRKVVKDAGEELGIWKKAKTSPYTAVHFLAEYGSDLEKEWEGALCLEKFALMLGAAIAGHPYKPLAKEAEKAKEYLGDTAERIRRWCVIDGYLLADGELTPLTRELLLAMAALGKMPKPFASQHGKALEEAEKLVEAWRGRGGARWWELFYGLGLAVMATRAGVLDRKAAVKALAAAQPAVQRVASPIAIGVILNALSPLREHAPDMWTTVLYAAATLSVDEPPALAKRILEEVKWAKERVVEDWAKALLAAAYATVLIQSAEATKLHGDVCQLLGGIQDPDLRILVEVDALRRFAARGLPPCGVDLCTGEAREDCVESLEKAFEKKVGELSSKLAELSKKAERGELSPELEKYLAIRSLERPQEALQRALSVAEVMLYYSLAEVKLDAGRLEEAEEYFAKAAELDKKLRWWENYLVHSSYAARARVLKAGDLDVVVKLAEAFEKLWKEARELMAPTAEMLRTASFRLAEYLVYLAASGRMKEAAEVLREHGWLLRYENYVHVATLYMLSLLGVGAEAPDTKELLEALEGRIHPLLKPALAALLGLPPKPIKAMLLCAEATGASISAVKEGEVKAEIDLSQLMEHADYLAFCRDAYKAVMGDMEAFNRIRIRVKEWYKERLEPPSVLDRLDAGGLVQVLAPSGSLGRLILLLMALDEARHAKGVERERYRELARAHALVGKDAHKGTIAGTLFGKAAKAVENCKGEVDKCGDLKLALLKLYYYHF